MPWVQRAPHPCHGQQTHGFNFLADLSVWVQSRFLDGESENIPQVGKVVNVRENFPTSSKEAIQGERRVGPFFSAPCKRCHYHRRTFCRGFACPPQSGAVLGNSGVETMLGIPAASYQPSRSAFHCFWAIAGTGLETNGVGNNSLLWLLCTRQEMLIIQPLCRFKALPATISVKSLSEAVIIWWNSKRIRIVLVYLVGFPMKALTIMTSEESLKWFSWRWCPVVSMRNSPCFLLNI